MLDGLHHLAMDLLAASAAQLVADFFIKGGFFMALLVVLSIVALTVIIQRGFALRVASVLPPRIEREVGRLEPGDDLVRLGEIIEQSPSPLARIVATLIRHLSWPRSENAEAVQTQARHETARMESGLVILEITTGVAPIFGLLGTLSGLVGIFATLGASGDPVGVARGISEALNTTIMGLAVAAPSLIAHNYFMRKIEMMAVEMEAVTSELISKCYPTPGEQPSFQAFRADE
jgi:biopolymer transport protein ExbB